MSLPDGPVAADPMIGQLLGKDYQVLECIGVGGMGVVYLVEHAALRKRFAAKVLSKELAADVEARGRFQAEAHAASQLEHENIVSLTDYGLTADGRPYLIMEFLRGRTLEQRLAEGPLTLEEIVAIVVPVARGLAEAHAEGIVHRDVKPENVFLTQRSGGRWGVKVLDFGIAKIPVRSAKLTKTGQALGSPMYMAPEACRGDEVDHRADIYSLGVLMYLLWCGRVPFDDDNLLKILQMQVSDPVPSPRRLNPEMSLEIEVVILRALEKDPDRRFLTIAELLAELEAALPEGADRLLIEAARGTTSMRALSDLGMTPYPARTSTGRPQRPSDPMVTAPTQPSPAVVSVPVRTPSATRADDPVPGRPPRRGRLLAAVAAIAIAGIVVFFVTRSRDHGDDEASARAGSQAVRPEPGPSGASAGSGTEPAGTGLPGVIGAPSIDAAPVAPAVTRIVVRTERPGARVSLDGRPLGATPLSIELAAAAGTGVLRVEQDGFAPWTRAIELDGPVELDAALVAIRKTPPRPPGRPPSGRRPGGAGAGTGTGSGSSTSTSGDPPLGIRARR